MSLRRLLCTLLLCLVAPGAALAATAPFDLAGPALEVKVTHAGVTLPIAEVPGLAAGDRLWIRADLPAGQSARYLLVAAFLRGATDPPPKRWFHRLETWTPEGAKGLSIVVPAGARQAMVFLAPRTGGDFATLENAVRGRPGAFVRASQDLNQASLDRSRLDAFLAAVRKTGPADAARLKTVTPLLARSLTIKLNDACFQKMPELQAACLMQGGDELVLDDGHGASLVQTLTSGGPSELALELSATPKAGFGYYSPYIAAVMDFARILDSVRTAHYQYIPALATARGERLALLLNTPPSFHSPLSVLVSALAPVEPAPPPALLPVDPGASYCAQDPDLVLPLEGAPLAFSTGYGRDLALRVKTPAGAAFELPLTPDPERGGFVVDARGADFTGLGASFVGVVHGQWGFAAFEGPSFRLENAHGADWRLAGADRAAPVVGRTDTVHLEGPDAACVEKVTLRPPSGEAESLAWKVQADGRLAVTLPLTGRAPGAMTLLVTQYGAARPQAIPIAAFAQAGRLDSFTLHAGDAFGVLKGSRLDEVASLDLAGADFKPGTLASADGVDELTLSAPAAGAAAALKAGETRVAKVRLQDGRLVRLKVEIAAPRPQGSLIGTSIEPAPAAGAIAIELASADELPQHAQMTFSVGASPPTRFSGKEAIEVASAGGAARVRLTAANGLVFEDSHVVLARLDPGKAFGASAFGPLRFRIVGPDGAAGDWRPLATLVRLPTLRRLTCRRRAATCDLTGSDLFLIDQVSRDADFAHAAQVPEGFPGETLAAPRPADGRLYIKLHDDPDVINRLAIPARGHAARAPGPPARGPLRRPALPRRATSPPLHG
ncbi:MAG TPA: hypothetical protein VMU93_04310 [Caulobacteraceae bacterium]|nr:hypothetical protein [Caulobacteraceae bacterium]